MASERLLKYYQDELEFLVEGGKTFAAQYPDLAKRLDFSSFSSNDPDVQRLIESTAFLNAKLQQRLDEQAPEIASEILNSIYPQFNCPIPPMTIMHFSNSGRTTFEKIINRGCTLTSVNQYEGQNYIFKTTMDVKIQPCEIEEIQFVKTYTTELPAIIQNLCENIIKIDLNKTGPINDLIFYIHMPDLSAYSFYEAIMNVLPTNTPVFENAKEIGTIERIGFNDESNLFPSINNENTAYKILTEYNSFPKKFLFFKIKFSQSPDKTILIPTNTKKEMYITKNDLLLNCTPAINLFEKNSEPINITHKDTSYIISADSNVQKNIAIHSIISLQDTQFNSQKKYLPYYSCNHLLNPETEYVFWKTKLQQNKNLKTWNMILSLHDTTFDLEKNVLYAKLLCFQQNCDQFISYEENWNIADTPGNITCINLDKPTATIKPLSNSQMQWRLISHLAINHFGFADERSLSYIKELLAIYNFEENNNQQSIFALKEFKYTTNMMFYNGSVIPQIQAFLTADNKQPAVFLLAQVLGSFLAKILEFNTKFELILLKNNNNQVWKKWQII